jgi:putative ABC transport system permease protein
VHERTREVGLLRAVGLSRRQLRRTIRYEAIIISLIGATTGVALGIAGAAGIVCALRDEGLTDLSVPVTRLGLYVLVAVLAGVLAAAMPARRASNLDILRAISHE